MNVYHVLMVADEAPIQIEAAHLVHERGTLIFYGDEERGGLRPIIAVFNAFVSCRLIQQDGKLWSLQEGE